MPRPEYKEFQFCLMLPSNSDISRWKEDAKKAGISCSKYIYEMVEKAREIPAGPNLDTIQESAQARSELSRLRRELQDAKAARQKLETELFALRHQMLLAPTSTGKDVHSSELADLLQDGHVWRATEIMRELNIDPKNSDAIQILARQLRAFQDMKLVEEGPRGWKWIG